MEISYRIEMTKKMEVDLDSTSPNFDAVYHRADGESVGDGSIVFSWINR